MGKAALILVLAVTVSGSVLYMNRNQATFDMAATEAVHQERMLAKLAAESGFEVVMSRAKADFSDYRGSWTVETADGSFVMTASGPSSGPVTITSTGNVDGEYYSISADLESAQTRILDAVTLDGELKKFEFKEETTLSGIDTNPDGSAGGSLDVHALLATVSAAADLVEEEIEDEDGSAPGVDGSIDIYYGTPNVSLLEVAQDILDYSGSNLYEYEEDAKLEEMTMGSPSSPVVIRAYDKLELKEDFVGYGVIYAADEFKMEKNARWEGLVFVERNKAKVETKNEPQLYGALVVRTVATIPEDDGDKPGERGLPGGHFDLDVFDKPDADDELYHEHKYDDDYDVTGVSLLDPEGCKYKGGLCWDDLMADEEAVYVEFMNPIRGYGTYTIAADEGSYGSRTVAEIDEVGRVEDDLPSDFIIAADQLTEFSIEFDALCALEISSPGAVIEDPIDRNGAFTIRLFRADPIGSSNWQKGELVYELAIYHHIGYGMWVNDGGEICDPTDDSTEEFVVAAGEAMEVKIKDESIVKYSSLALSRLKDILPIVDPTSDNYMLTNYTAGFNQ